MNRMESDYINQEDNLGAKIISFIFCDGAMVCETRDRVYPIMALQRQLCLLCSGFINVAD